MWRRGVAYDKFFPDAWTCQPPAPVVPGMARAPWVYMPTDTTQLGFYYQQVPYWQPVAGMVPVAPNPNDWHAAAVCWSVWNGRRNELSGLRCLADSGFGEGGSGRS